MEGVTVTRGRPGVLVAAHLPPPVHGMSVATAAFVEALKEEASKSDTQLSIHRISADSNRTQIGHHLERIGRVLTAVVSLLRHRHSLTSLYVSVDADFGMIYTMALCGAARLCHITSYAHHHSASYLGQAPKWRVQLLCRVAGPAAHHIMACPDAVERFESIYPKSEIDLVPMWFAINDPSPSRQRVKPTPSHVTIGHMSNLRLEKGLKDVFDTADSLAARGIPTRLVLAGQPRSEQESAFLALQGDHDRFVLDYRGPVFGRDREDFFADIDVFVFPSVYRHEYTPLVLGESIARGIPIVTRETICCRKEFFERAGLVLHDDADFVAESAKWIEDLLNIEDMWDSLSAGMIKFKCEFKEAGDRASEVARNILGIL